MIISRENQISRIWSDYNTSLPVAIESNGNKQNLSLNIELCELVSI